MIGVDQGIAATKEVVGFLAYDNRLVGNNVWSPKFINSNLTWNDDGIRAPGFGNAVFNNTLIGFGDTLSFAMHSEADTLTESIGVHFYRNDVRNSGDDFAEIDDGHRNLTLYDNRSHNSMTFISIDPLYGGPLVVARNTAINVGRSPYKFTSPNTGHFMYNNTVVRTTGWHWVREKFGAESGWIQHRNGRQRAYGYRNNILIYRGVGDNLLVLGNRGHDPIDFTHNSWYPDRGIRWRKEKFVSLWDARNYIRPTSPVFSGITERHAKDAATDSNPWTVEVELGDDYRTEVTETYVLELAPDAAPKHSGAVIPNITDGFDGAAPDRGAIISGRPIPFYGDRSNK
jgi:hypothetical protein